MSDHVSPQEKLAILDLRMAYVRVNDSGDRGVSARPFTKDAVVLI